MAAPTPEQAFLSSKGNRYSFIHVPSPSELPTLLFLHGFPSHKHDWTNQKDFFSGLGYGVILIDLLGFGRSDAPYSRDSFRIRSMSDEIAEFLDQTQIKTPVVGIAHDLGTMLLSRLAVYHPSCIKAVVYLSVGPHKLGQHFNVDAINIMTKQMLGYEVLGYISWMVTDLAAQRILEQHAVSAMKLMFCADPKLWDVSLRPLGAMKHFVSEDRDTEVGSWFPNQLQKLHLDQFQRTGGYKGAINWYQMMANNESVPDEEGLQAQNVDKPTMLIASEHEIAQQKDMAAAWHTQLVSHALPCGHWIHLEKAAETNGLILEFIESLDVVSASQTH